MTRILAYFLSILFLVGFFGLDCRTQEYDTAIPYFGAVLFSLWSPRRIDVVVVAVLCLFTTIAGGYFSIDAEQTLPVSMRTVLAERSLSIFALVCVGYVGWQRRGISIRLQQMNELLEKRVDISEKESTEIQQQLSQISLALDQHTVERRKKERGFRETIASYQTLLESLPINVFQKNRKACLIFGNTRYFETLGKQKEECLGKTDFDLFPEELARKYHNDDQAVLRTGTPVELIEEHIRPDGQKIYVQVFKAPIRNTRNKIVGLQGMFWDVTDRIQAEELQKESDARFRSLVASNIIGIFTGTFEGRIVDANDEFLDMVGYTRDEFNQDRLYWRDLTPAEFSQTDQLMESEVVKKGFCRPVEKEYFHKDGRRIPVLVGAVRLDTDKDEVICSVVDITRQKEAELALKVARDAADEANRAKTLFLANISHEIRTPLNAIIGMTELVLQSQVNQQQGEYLGMVHDSGEALLEIINDILDFSKLQAGKLKLEPTEFSLHTKLAEWLRPLSIRGQEKGLEIVCEVAETVPDQVYGDPVCLRQVITNLLGNAIKFTEAGKIAVFVAVASTEGNSLKLHVSVSDTGPGIEPNLQRKIFKEFEQADNTSTRKYGGAGLGLAISLNLVKLMDGEIWVESAKGQGSTFHFTSTWENRSQGNTRVRVPVAVAVAKQTV
ncbi:MAG: PAS domain S-box protein, partial [Planctomycetota bacterium]|nr:PAS domain S-box protein [Planctomycetota bacterium]